MESFFLWLEELPISLTIAESQSIWGFPLILFLHSIGIALTAGPATMMGLRILGVARPMPLSSLRTLFRFFWAGFVMNVITGTLLFMMAATRTGYKPMYYAKLTFLLFALLTLRPIRAVIESDLVGSDSDIPSRVKTMAALSLLLWAGVITTGRLIAYFR
jgi:hypothetical protein